MNKPFEEQTFEEYLDSVRCGLCAGASLNFNDVLINLENKHKKELEEK